MVNDAFGSEEREILLNYAPRDTRAGAAALLALDDQLASIVRTTRDPMVGQMRLTWWYGALEALSEAPAPAEPVLRALSATVVPHLSGAELARLVEGWEALIDPAPLDAGRMLEFADLRGAALFAAIGRVVGASDTDPVRAAGAGWALADLAANVSDPATAAQARTLADERLRPASIARWTRPARMLGAMAHLAAMPDASPPRRAARALWHRLTGR